MKQAREKIEYRTCTQSEIEAQVKKHALFYKGRLGGTRADFSFCDLSGLDLSSKDFRDAEFSGAILANADLSHSKFDAATFFGADLRGADLRYASFVRADFRGACLRGVRGDFANFFEADMREGVIAERAAMGLLNYLFHDIDNPLAPPLVLSGSALELIKGNSDPTMYADFSDASLRGTTFEEANLKSAVLRGADLSEANFKSADLSDADLGSAVINDVIFIGAKLVGAVRDPVQQANLAPTKSDINDIEASLKSHRLWVESGGKKGSPGEFASADMRSIRSMAGGLFTALHAPGSNWSGMDLTTINLQGANLQNADFRGSTLRGADLRGVDLRGADMSGCKLDRADLSPLSLGQNRLHRSNIDNATLRYARLNNANLHMVSCKGSDLCYTTFKGADLRDANFTGADLVGAVGDHQSFRGVTFDRARGLKLVV